jgi:hypothetical protein
MTKKQLSRAKSIWQDTKNLDTVAMYITGLEKTHFQGILNLIDFINLFVIGPLKAELATKDNEIKELKQKLQIKELIGGQDESKGSFETDQES